MFLLLVHGLGGPSDLGRLTRLHASCMHGRAWGTESRVQSMLQGKEALCLFGITAVAQGHVSSHQRLAAL